MLRSCLILVFLFNFRALLGLPPGIRKAVWPLAISNSLCITPELFEILSQKASELRALEQLACDGNSSSSSSFMHDMKNNNQKSVTARQENHNDHSNPTIDDLMPCSRSNSQCNSSDCPLASSTSDANNSKGKEEMLIRASLAEILKKSKFNKNNRESSLVCIAFDIHRTFPHLPQFRKCTESGDLEKVLQSWVIFRPDVGYVSA